MASIRQRTRSCSAWLGTSGELPCARRERANHGPNLAPGTLRWDGRHLVSGANDRAGRRLFAGCIPQDPAPGYDPAGLALAQPTAPGLLHLAAAGIAATASVVLLLIVAARLSGDAYWSGWATYTSVIALLTVVCVAIYGTRSIEPNGLAGTFERAAIFLPTLWGCTFLHRLWMGRPFMRHPAPLEKGDRSAI